MGREIRRVPKDWVHPMNPDPIDAANRCAWQPMLDIDYESAMKEFEEGKALWEKGQHKYQLKDPGLYDGLEYEGDCFNRPEPHEHRPYWPPESMTHYQLYETVTEGSPCSPVFATLKELEDYLVEYGDLWFQFEKLKPWERKTAHSFCQEGWAPSAIIRM